MHGLPYNMAIILLTQVNQLCGINILEMASYIITVSTSTAKLYKLTVDATI